jgi:hypothetical protein
VPNQTPYDASFGPHTFTVTATDAAGHVTTRTTTYRMHPAENFCAATALRVGATSYASSGSAAGCSTASLPANPPATAADLTSTLRPVTALLGTGAWGLPNLTVEAQGLWAWARARYESPDPQAAAEVGRIRIESLLLNQHIEISGARSSVDQQIDDVDPNQDCRATNLTGHSSVTFAQREDYIVLLGKPAPLLTISTPMAIPLGIGTLYLNQTVVTGQVVTQRALFLDLPGTANDVVAAESSSGLLCR